MELRCSWQALPFGLSVVLSDLQLLHGGLWMAAGGVFAVCAWFGWLFEWWWGLALRLLGMNLWSEAPF
jgi:hypothetical protein